jgi:hypothetical protein
MNISELTAVLVDYIVMLLSKSNIFNNELFEDLVPGISYPGLIESIFYEFRVIVLYLFASLDGF